MTGQTAALPRLRIRFHKPRPPSQWTVILVLWIVLCLQWIWWDITTIASGKVDFWTAADVLTQIAGVFAFRWFWRQFRRIEERSGLPMAPPGAFMWFLTAWAWAYAVQHLT